MELSHNDDNNSNVSLFKFETMLKTNNVLFFDSEEFEIIVHHYLEKGKISLAKKAIKLGLEQHPSSVSLKLFKSEIYIFENELDLADELLNELHELEPHNEDVYIQKANILSKQDKHNEAIQVLKSALIFTDDTSDINSLIGMEYMFLDEFENAKLSFIECLNNDNRDYSALYNVIYCFDFLDQNEEAIKFLNDFLENQPYCEVAWHQLGKQYFTIKEYSKALTAFDFAIISDDTFLGAYMEKGKVLEKLGKYNEAIENYNITLSIDDPTSFALLRIGNCHEKLGNNDLAMQFYYKTVHEDPLLDKGWIAITKFFKKNKNYQKALHYINKAINIDGENPVYWKLYAQINEQLNFYEESENGYKKSLELGNYELETWLSRADILLKLGEYESTIVSLEQALEFYPDHAEIEYRLSGVYFTTNQPNKGNFHLNNALNCDSDYSFVLEELFPEVYSMPHIQEIILPFKNTSK